MANRKVSNFATIDAGDLVPTTDFFGLIRPAQAGAAKMAKISPANLAAFVNPPLVVTDAPYNALGDGVEILDGAITNADATLTSATANFTSADVGKIILVDGAGATGAFGSISGTPARAPLATTIASVTNSTTVELSASAQATVSNARCIYGTNDTAAIQSALDDASSLPGAAVVFPQNRMFFISSALAITRYSDDEDELEGGGKYGSILISGYGAYLVSAESINFITITPTDIDSIYHSPVIEGLSFEGVGGSGQTGVSLSYTYGAVVRDLKMRRVGTGVDFQFGLMGRIENILVDYFTQYGVRLRRAGAGTPTNAAVVDGARCRPSSIGLASFYLTDADQCELRNCISEQPTQWAGTAFVADVVLDNTNTLGDYNHGLLVRNFYSEVSAYTTAMFAIINDGYTVLEGVTHQHEISEPLVDVSGSDASIVVCRDWTLTTSPIAPANGWILFKQDDANNVGWIFENMGEIGRGEVTDLTLDTFWVDGDVPALLTQIEAGRVKVLGDAPTIVSAEIGAVDDSTIAVTLSEDIKAGNYLLGWSVTLDGTPATLDSAARQVTKSVLHLVLSAPAGGSDVVELSYAAIDGFIQDEEGNQLGDVTDFLVTNDIDPATTLLEDIFTDTNGTLLTAHTMNTGPGWTKIEGSTNEVTIQSNKAQSALDAGSAYSYVSDAGEADVNIELVAVLGSGGTAGDHAVEIVLRATDGSNMFFAGISDAGANNVFLYKLVAGAPTLLDQDTASLSAGTPYTLVLTASGDNISLTVEGVTVNGTDAFQNTATEHGLRFVQLGGAANTIDNFEATD